MEAACARLMGLGKPGALICSTDADTVMAPDWLAAQLAAADRGARAIGGRIELDASDPLSKDLLRWHTRRGYRRRRRLLSDPTNLGTTEHWQFSGASLSLTAAVYREVGGLEPRNALEDEHLEAVLREPRIPIERLVSVRVTTSARLVGRARRDLARDLDGAARRFVARRNGKE